MKLYGGIDLHSNNSVIALLDVSFRQLCVDLCLGDAMMHGRGTAALREN
jgi:hypothetical protein